MINEYALNDAIRTLIIMSISGSIVAVLLFALKPLVRNRLPKSAQYYLWLVAVSALLIPVSVFVKLPVATENAPTIMSPSNVVERYFITGEEEMDRMGALDSYGAREASNPIYMQAVKEAQSPITSVATFFPFIYPLGVLIVLLYYISSYFVFTRLQRRQNIEAQENELTLLNELNSGKRTPQLYRNPMASTPMLIGLFRSAIILPDREYTVEQLHAVLLHELTHLRRKDILVKWLSVFACAVHWFNPIVWIVRREIDRACELSCDEAVIRNLDTNGKQNYGETLLYVAADSKTPLAVLSTTMCEEKKALKERLGAIMKSKKHTRLAIILSTVLIFAVGGTAVALGTGRTEGLTLPSVDEVLSISMNQYNGYIQSGEVVITNKNEIRQILNNLSGASKLWGMSGTSVNDNPVKDNYLAFELTMQNGSRRLSLYTDGSNYIEEPYIGIYQSKQRFDYVYSLYSDYHNELMPNAITENETRPVLTLYGFDQSKDNGNTDDVKKHFTSRLQPDGDTGVTVLTDMIFIDVQVPEVSLSVQTYYAETGGQAYRMYDSKWSEPQKYSQEGLFQPNGNTFIPREINPDGFTGSIWAVTTDVDGVEHTSDVIPVTWFDELSKSQLKAPSSEESPWQQIHLGTPIETVHELLGEPSGTTSGLWSEIYKIDENNWVTFHYKADEKQKGVVSLIIVNDKQIEPWQKDIVPIPAKWTRNQSLGADNPSLDYAGINVEGHNWVIFHSYFGLFVYDTDAQKIVYSLDLKAIGCDSTQGDASCEVTVNDFGDVVTLHPVNSDTMFILNLWDSGNRLFETPVKGNENYINPFTTVSIETAFSSADYGNLQHGKYSDRAVMFASTSPVGALNDSENYYGYLYFNDTSLGGINYIVDDMMFELFK